MIGVVKMINFELRIVLALGFTNTLQYRTKDKWADGTTVNNGKYIWSDWKNVPMVWNPKYKPEDK